MKTYTIKPLGRWTKNRVYSYTDRKYESVWTPFGFYHIDFRAQSGEYRDVWVAYFRSCRDFNCEKWLCHAKTKAEAKKVVRDHYVERLKQSLINA